MIDKDIFKLHDDEVKENPKKVRFCFQDDIAYIYPWSPTKFLLYGKYSEEQLKRKRKKDAKESYVTPILKKTVLSNDNLPNGNIVEYEELNNLNEINIAETVPIDLPPEAIFSPSKEKDLLTKSPKMLGQNEQQTVNKTVIEEKNFRKLKRKSLLPDTTDVNPKTIEFMSMNALPYLYSNKVSDTVCAFGKDTELKNNKRSFQMPSINSKLEDSFCRNPIIRSQISQRYAIDENELQNIQNLHEEELTIGEERNSSNQTRRPLPVLRDKKNIISLNDSSTSKSTLNDKRTSKKPPLQVVNGKINKPSQKDNLISLSNKAKHCIPQLYISPSHITRGCWK